MNKEQNMVLPSIAALASQLAPAVLPYLPYLLKGVNYVGKKLGEVNWDVVLKVWERLRPQVEEQPEVKQHLEEAAQKPDDPRAAALVSWDLEKILAALPPQQLTEIQTMLSQSTTETRTVTASGERAVAIGGSADHATITTGDQGPSKKE
jgi:hypothetical protein